MKKYLLYNISKDSTGEVAEHGTPENGERIAKTLKDNNIWHAFCKNDYWSYWVMKVTEEEILLLSLMFSKDEFFETKL
jgi:hypothetical protein